MIATSAVLDRARAYLDRIPHAVSGAGGHGQTFKAACALVHGFDLSEGDALSLLSEWNARCDPPWSEPELRHKIQSASKAPCSKPRGYLLGDSREKRAYQPTPIAMHTQRPTVETKPDRSGFAPGTPEQIRELSGFRYHREAIEWASMRGVLVFGVWHEMPCYGVTDQSGRALELRRIAGGSFPAVASLQERKAHAVKNSQKSWPIGIIEAKDAPAIALVEGIPDFIAAHYLAIWEQSPHHSSRDTACFPVTMLSGSPAIHPDALSYFEGKHVRLFPHVDKTGFTGALKWQQQLRAAGARTVDVFDFSHYTQEDGSKVKDLEDFAERIDPKHYISNPDLFRILP